jgi:pimeloyl-ACP methyl ester carboxylesterase
VREARHIDTGRDPVNPMFFGSSAQPLYGVYHAPKARVGRQTGVVLCNSFGQEYMRSHRAFRQVALLLCKAGFHVFRFDYQGTGDSSGECAEFTLAGAVQDTEQAIQELQDMADVETVALFGLRLGGAVAARVAQRREEVTTLVLWDAVADGATYLSELRGNALAEAGAARQGDGGLAVMGFPVPVMMQQELTALRFDATSPSRRVKALVVSDTDTSDARACAAWCAAGGQAADTLIAPLPGRWDEVDNWGSAMIPQDAIRSIVEWITTEVR